jgi:phage baseplate assembly protein W
MSGYSPILPLIVDKIDGPYASNKEAQEAIKQNLKMLLLTNPGERIMNRDFGAGIRALLFEQDTENLRQTIYDRIESQINKYLDYIIITNISINSIPESENALYVLINYRIPSIGSEDQLIINTSSI